VVVITSNRTREIHEALKRRCIYYWIDYPSRQKELDIVRLKVPHIAERLARQVVDFVQAVRQQELYKLPGVAETLDWAEALGHLQRAELDLATIEATLGLLLKYQDDVDKLKGRVAQTLVEQVIADGEKG
jgi:MoxR-like ATPase